MESPVLPVALTDQKSADLEVFQGEAISLLQHLGRELLLKPSLIFMDPPFNFGVNYGEHCNDKREENEFCLWMQNVMFAASEILAHRGSLWFNVPDEMAADVDHYCVRQLGLKRHGWCIWHYRFGFYSRDRFTRSKSHALWYGNSDSPVFNGDEVLVESVRQSIGDDRAEFGGRVPMDVWGFERYWGRVQGNSKERRPLHKNQLPEVYLERVIRACTNEGDVVVDPFLGSGTTGVVARALGRRFFGGDLGTDIALSALERIRAGAIRV